jgi:hypothetical protein
MTGRVDQVETITHAARLNRAQFEVWALAFAHFEILLQPLESAEILRSKRTCQCAAFVTVWQRIYLPYSYRR